jgi:PTS system nitrogen regulatory IIA component
MESVTHTAVRRMPAPLAEPPISHIADLLESQDILLDWDVADKVKLFESIDQHMVNTHGLTKGLTMMSLRNRERIGSTGLGDGVAVPHARVQNLREMHLLYIRLQSPIAFDAPDGKPVVDVLVLLVPDQARQLHLNILADISRVFADRRFRVRLNQCTSDCDVKQLFNAWSLWV